MASEQLKNPTASRTLRIMTFCVGLGLIILGFKIFALFTIIDILDFILSTYYVIFGVLLCFSELPFPCLLDRVSFLKYFYGKAIFLSFLGTITFDSGNILHILVSVMCFVCGLMYLILAAGCRDFLTPADEEQPQEYKPVSYGAMGDQKPLTP